MHVHGDQPTVTHGVQPLRERTARDLGPEHEDGLELAELRRHRPRPLESGRGFPLQAVLQPLPGVHAAREVLPQPHAPPVVPRGAKYVGKRAEVKPAVGGVLRAEPTSLQERLENVEIMAPLVPRGLITRGDVGPRAVVGLRAEGIQLHHRLPTCFAGRHAGAATKIRLRCVALPAESSVVPLLALRAGVARTPSAAVAAVSCRGSFLALRQRQRGPTLRLADLHAGSPTQLGLPLMAWSTLPVRRLHASLTDTARRGSTAGASACVTRRILIASLDEIVLQLPGGLCNLPQKSRLCDGQTFPFHAASQSDQSCPLHVSLLQ
mmetsp:Transcript_13789/g.34728  ORF Transcript_13789/g.34728 Transcript_13789/m.34728 type:complete len:322 (-) Transcript_13789:67-1032(-)